MTNTCKRNNYLEYEYEPQKKSENYDAPARLKLRWIKKNDNLISD
jgi:hypothetical protein